MRWSNSNKLLHIISNPLFVKFVPEKFSVNDDRKGRVDKFE